MKMHIKKIISSIHKKKINKVSNKKLKKLKANVVLRKKNSLIERDYIELWKKLEKKPSTLFLSIMRSISGIDSSKYVPENIHYGIIEPTLNNRAYALTYNDKNFFERYLPDFKDLFPVAVLRGINGVLHDAAYKMLHVDHTTVLLNKLRVNDFFILKPATETGGGENVLLIQKNQNGFIVNDNSLSTEEFMQFLKVEYRNDFILQHKLNQLPWFHDFNKSSLNTVRLYAYRSVKDEEVHPFHAYIRFGGEGSLVDSSSQGGRTCGVSQDGILNDFALGKYGEKFKDLECINSKKGKPVPHFMEMKSIAKEIAKSFYYHRLLGFDFCVDEDDNVRLLEVNNLYIGVINQQMNNGPLFGEFTDEVIDYCKVNKKTVAFHFNI